jgi:hypothetical protein
MSVIALLDKVVCPSRGCFRLFGKLPQAAGTRPARRRELGIRKGTRRRQRPRVAFSGLASKCRLYVHCCVLTRERFDRKPFTGFPILWLGESQDRIGSQRPTLQCKFETSRSTTRTDVFRPLRWLCLLMINIDGIRFAVRWIVAKLSDQVLQ